MTRIFKWLNNSHVIVALLFITVIAWLISIGQVYDLSKTDWATWVGSVGTVGTLIGTIWISTAETRRRERAELILAKLHGAALINRIDLASISVLALVKMLAARTDVDSIEDGFYGERLASLNALSLWQVSDLVPLVPLPNNTAAKLAQAVDQVVALKRHLEWGQAGIPGPRSERERTREIILAKANVIRFQLRDALAECRKTQVTVGSIPPA